MADQEQLDDFSEALEARGGSAKNPALQAALGWTDDLDEEVRAELSTKIVGRGRGRSDSVAMVGAGAPAAAATAPSIGRKARASGNGAGPIAFEAQLWKAADALRNTMDAAEYKHVVLGLLFLKSISDAFEARWSHRNAQAPQPAIGSEVDAEMDLNLGWLGLESIDAHLAATPDPAD